MKKHFIGVLFPALLAMALAPASFAQVVVSVRVAPPVLPVYAQPICPAPGYLWTPGYWAYGPAGYYWVPGVWVQPPAVGLLWTPGYWGFAGGVYGWHAGYWGPHVGFYGGVNYGFGYGGVGFGGGMWVGGAFRYNTAVMHVGPGFHDTYVDRRAIVEGGPRYSFNGPGGLSARPTAADRIAERDHHIERTSMQASHEHSASLDRSARFSENHGRPSNMAMSRPGGARPAENRAGARPGPANRPAEHGAAGRGVPNRAGGAAPHAGPAGGNAGHANAGHAPSGGGRSQGKSAPNARGGGQKGGEHQKN